VDTIEKVKAAKLELIQKRMKLTAKMQQIKGQIAQLNAQGQQVAAVMNSVIGQLELCDNLLEVAKPPDEPKPEPQPPARE